MKRFRINLIALSIVALALAGIAIWKARHLPPLLESGRTPSPVESNAINATPVPASPEVVTDNPRVGVRKAPLRNPEETVAKFNAPINFWGKVVDQDGKPLSGVKVRYEVRYVTVGAGLWPDYRFVADDILTGGDGHFAITGRKGDDLNVVSLTKDGYRIGSRTQRSFIYAQAPEIFTPDKQKPVTFVMVKQLNEQKLKQYSPSFRLAFDGTKISLDPLTGRRVENGRLKLSCVREPATGIVPLQGYPWRLTVELEGGGLMAIQPQAFYEAPADGYQPRMVYEMTAIGADWRNSTKLEYYFKTSDNIYGRISVQVSLRNDEPEAFIGLDGMVNPSGSRSLEAAGAQSSAH